MGFINSTPPSWVDSTSTKFYRNIQYGDVNITNLDLMAPQGTGAPTPCIINIHGGSFAYGDKTDIYEDLIDQGIILDYLDKGIAYVSINYKLVSQFEEVSGIKRCFDSAVLAIQFIKYYADIFNIDKNKIALNGGSAGGGISLWIASSPDLADPSNQNLIKRESTSIHSLSLNIAQATYDLVKWESEVFAVNYPGYSLELDYNTNKETKDSVDRTYGIKSYSELLTEPTLSLRNELDMLRLMGERQTVDTYLFYSNTLAGAIVNNTIIDGVHSDYMGKAISNKMGVIGTNVLADLRSIGIDSTGGISKEDWLISRLIT
tara:strand:- start:206 stop:1159 length:954 start_codon:yes stop_codon:yes gene_type:complete